MSERSACDVLDQPRSRQRYESKPRDDEPALVKRMLDLARRRPRLGYRRMAWQFARKRGVPARHGCSDCGVGKG